MRTIERTRRFKRDYRREYRGRHRKDLDAWLVPIVTALADDSPLDERHHDHALSGPWADFRDCHVRPDLVLIYKRNFGFPHGRCGRTTLRARNGR